MNTEDQILYNRMRASFTNITPSEEEIRRIESLRAQYKGVLMGVFEMAPNTREREIALTHLETSLMYAVKAVLMSA